MLCLEVHLNSRRVARAGGMGVKALHVSLGGGREGPIGLTVHGLLQDDDDHLVWVNELIESSAEVTCNVLTDTLADIDPPAPKRLIPIPTKRHELNIEVEINGQHCCKAQIGDLEFIGADIEGRGNEDHFILKVTSGAHTEDEISKEREWLTRKLVLGDSAIVRVRSESDE